MALDGLILMVTLNNVAGYFNMGIFCNSVLIA